MVDAKTMIFAMAALCVATHAIPTTHGESDAVVPEIPPEAAPDAAPEATLPETAAAADFSKDIIAHQAAVIKQLESTLKANSIPVPQPPAFNGEFLQDSTADAARHHHHDCHFGHVPMDFGTVPEGSYCKRW